MTTRRLCNSRSKPPRASSVRHRSDCSIFLCGKFNVFALLQYQLHLTHAYELSLFLDLPFDWATSPSKLLGLSTRLPQRWRHSFQVPCPSTQQASERIKHNHTRDSMFSTLHLSRWAPTWKTVVAAFWSIFVWLDKGNEPQVYRLRNGRSYHYTIASV